MNKILIYTIITVTLLSCGKDVENNTIANNDEQITEGSTDILYVNSSVYSKFFDENVDREVGYFSTKEHVNCRNIAGFDISHFSDMKSVTSISSSFVNSIEINSLGNTEHLKTAKIDNYNYDDLFGRDVSFTISNKNTKSVEIHNESISMYIPFVIDINYPVASATELMPLCPHDDLLLEWNNDENNVNGVVIIIEWDGDMIGTDKRKESIRTVDLVDDTGEAILNQELFTNIPDLAVINITIMRGNIDIVEIEDTAVKIYAFSNSSISVVLAKEPI